MPLPKGILSSHVWGGLGIGVWALYFSIVLLEVLDSENLVSSIFLVLVIGYLPLGLYVIWLRKRIRKAKAPNGELVLELEGKIRQLATIRRANAIGDATSVTVFGISGLFCIGLLGFQCYRYLRYGEWVSKGWTDMGWSVPQTSWVGAQSIIDWVASQHAGLIVCRQPLWN